MLEELGLSKTALPLGEPDAVCSTIVDVLRWRATNEPDQIAFTYLLDPEGAEESITYAELDKRARAIAVFLYEQQAVSQRALLLLPSGLEYVAAFYGCLYAGVTAVPGFPPDLGRLRFRESWFRAVMKDAQARIAFTTDQGRNKLISAAGGERQIAETMWLSPGGIDPSLADRWVRPEIFPETLAFVQYTSGSTSMPKGVMIGHSNVMHNQGIIQSAFCHGPDSTIVSWLPLHHDMGLVGTVLQPVYIGARSVLIPPTSFLQAPICWLNAISRYRGKSTAAPNFGYEYCVRKISPLQKKRLDLTSLTTAVIGAEPVSAETVDRFMRGFQECGFRKDAFRPSYGLAEATLMVTGARDPESNMARQVSVAALEQHMVRDGVGDEPTRTIVGCGIVLGGQELRIVDPQSKLPCDNNRVGEIWVTGASVGHGYWQRREETEAIFGARLVDGTGPFLRSGDLGFIDNGQLFVTGRLKDLIIIRGKNFYPQDIEASLQTCHPAVRPACGAAFGVLVQDEAALVVVNEVERHPEIPAEKLISMIREKVSREIGVRPYAVILVRTGTIPKTTSGKIRRSECRKAFLEHTLKVVAGYTSGPLEQESEEICDSLDLLAVPPDAREQLLSSYLRRRLLKMLSLTDEQMIGDTPLISLGLDSLIATELSNIVEQATGVRLDPSDVLAGLSLNEAVQSGLKGFEAAPQFNRTPGQNEPEIFPLSFGQRGLWALYCFAPDSTALNLSSSGKIVDLEVNILRDAFRNLMVRHGALRTVFRQTSDGPMQTVIPASDISFQQHFEFRDVSKDSAVPLPEMLSREAQRLFSLESYPPIRLTVLKSGTNEHFVVLALHHIIADFWSINLLLRDLGVLYSKARKQEAAALETVSECYAGFVKWQKLFVESPRGEECWDYWSQRLQHIANRPLQLPADRPRTPAGADQGTSEPLSLEENLYNQLSVLARSQNVTVFLILAAAYQLLLHRVSGQKRVCLGVPTHGRNRSRFSDVVGYFVNPVVLESQYIGEQRFTSYLAEVKRTALQAFHYQDYPFSLIVEKLNPYRAVGMTPIFQTMFVWQKAQFAEMQSFASAGLGNDKVMAEVDDLRVEVVPLPSGGSQYDLTLLITERAERLVGAWHYNPGLFDRSTIQSFGLQYSTLLETIVRDPETQIFNLTGFHANELSPDDHGVRLAGDAARKSEQQVHQQRKLDSRRMEVPEHRSQDHTEFPRKCLHEMFEAQTAASPDQVAAIFEDTNICYADLNQRANLLAHRLTRLGMGPERIVGICIEPGVEMLVGVLGILKAGAAYLPLERSYPDDRLELMLSDAQAAALIADESSGDRFRFYKGPQLRVNRASRVESPDELKFAGQHGLTACTDNAAYVIYTSGSTGRPKGVVVSHLSAVNLALAHISVFRIDSASRVLQFAPLGFDASVSEIFATLLAGGQLVFTKRDALLGHDLAQILNQHQISVVTLPPSVLATVPDINLPFLKTLVVAGESCPRELLQRWAGGTRMLNAYGPTEATVCATVSSALSADGDCHIGRPLMGVQVYLLDENMSQVPVGTAGELYIGGAGLARGYLGRPELTAQSTVPNPFAKSPGERIYRTGDLAKWREDGNLEYLGRTDEQVKIRGFRVELKEIEVALRECPGVCDAVAVAEKELDRSRIVGYVVAQTSAELNVREIQNRLKRRLPEYMQPAILMMIPSLPLTGNGKLDRKQLPKPEVAAGGEYVSPRSDEEKILCDLWLAVLKCGRVGIHDDFFDLGGHSLLATQVASRLRTLLDVEIPVRILLEARTVEQLATRIKGMRMLKQQLLPPLLKADRGKGLPLSAAERRLWFIHQMEPDDTAYSMPFGTRISGELDCEALQRSFREMIRRHEALRTGFGVEYDNPVQIIAPGVDFFLSRIDLRNIAAAGRSAELQERIESYFQTPFDLSKPPLLRAALLQVNDSEYVLLVNVHHIVSDGWSAGIMAREISRCYSAYARGEDPELENLAIQYADVAYWERDWLSGSAFEDQLLYWKTKLAGVQRLDLPTDFLKRSAVTHPGARLNFRISPALAFQVRSFNANEGVTLFMTLAAALTVMLARYCRQEDVILGTVVANRNHKEAEALVGCFVNTLLLRTDLTGNPSLREVVKRVQKVALDAYQHQNVPFERLVEELQPERDGSRTPLFQVALFLQNMEQPRLELSGLELADLGLCNDVAKFDLAWEMIETNDGINGCLSYASDLYDTRTVRCMVDSYKTVLKSMVSNPDLSIGRCSLIEESGSTEGEIDELPTMAGEQIPERKLGWGQKFPVGDTCIDELFEACANERPDTPALVDGARRLTYGELRDGSTRIACAIRSRVTVNPLVGVCAGRNANLIMLLLGIMKAGGAYLPLDPALPAERLHTILRDARAGCVVADERGRERLTGVTVDVLNCDALANAPGQLRKRPAFARTAEQLAYVLFTSGSTGLPKGVAVTHRSAVNFIQWGRRAFLDAELKGVLASTSIGFDLSVFEIFVPLCSGGMVILAQNVLELCSLSRAEEVTLINTIPSAMTELLWMGKLPGSLKTVTLGAEPLPEMLPTRIFAETEVDRVGNLYGPTETTVYSAAAFIKRGNARMATIGQPIDNMRIYVLDEVQRPVPLGAVGEIFIAGEGLAQGYIHSPDLTADRFTPDPFNDDATGGSRMYRTGDLGRWRYDETLQCLGRLDNQVKVRGFRIELEEIEAVLLQQRGVREAAVAVQEFAGDRQLVGYITGDRLNINQLSATLRGRLPKYMVPAEWMELKSLPRLPNGKLNRRLLPQPVLKISNVSELPRTSTEKKLAEIWSDLLHIESIDRYDDFFGLGGHSLLATRMVSRIRASLNVSVPLQLVFQTTVLRDLAEQLEKLNHSNPEQIQLRLGIRNTPTPLSPAQQRFWLLQQLAPESAAYNVPFVAKISGKFDRETFSRSLNTVVNHHEVLRSKYKVIDGVPQQIPDPAGVADLVFMNLEYLGEKRDEGAQRTLEERARRIFDLAKKPPLQVTLLQLDRNTHWLLVTMHHIITDGWSIGQFVRELFHQYNDLLAGSESVAPPPRLQYSDVAAWQRQLVESGALEPELQYWERQLADLPPVLDLPRDMPNRAARSFSAAVHPIEFSSQYSGALIEFCRSHGFTPYVTMLAAFFVLMAKVAGQEDITVGSPIVNRDKLELEEVIGCLINTVVLRVRLKEGLSIAKLLTTVRQTVLDALRNQHIPFEQVIRRLRPPRGLDREQLFQVMFGLQDMPFQTSSIGEATVAPVRFTPLLLRGEVVDKCDLRFQLLQSAEGFGGFCEYNTQVFHESTIMWIVGAYLQVLEQIMSESYQRNPVDDIRIERTMANPAAR